MDDLIILRAIGSTEESTFGEFCRALGDDKPETGDRESWSKLFKQIKRLESEGLIEVCRTGSALDSLILSEAGAARVRGARTVQ